MKLCQLVRLLRGGEPVKMSKRAGDFVTLREVVDEVGRDPVRFMMLFRKNDAPLDFDLAKVVEQSKDNPVFYVQYAHARCALGVPAGRARRFPAWTSTPAGLGGRTSPRSTDEGETEILRRLAQFPRLVEAAAASHEPHRIAFYLYDLASAFHSFWNKGKDSPQLRFVNQTDPTLDPGEACSRSCTSVAYSRRVWPSWASRPRTRCARRSARRFSSRNGVAMAGLQSWPGGHTLVRSAARVRPHGRLEAYG